MGLAPLALASYEPTIAAHPLRHIRELDGVRGIAALMVFFHHLCFASIAPQGWGAPVRFLWSLSSMGDSGVDLFFVLSGFLITSLLVQARQDATYYRDFYWKRALRILPLYILCLLGILLFLPGTRDYVLLSTLFLSNFAAPLHVQSAGPFWSLAIEEQFYLLWPTFVRRRSVGQLQYFAVILGSSAILLRFLAAAFGHFNDRLTFLRCDGLAAGAWLACWYAQRQLNPNPVKQDRLIALAAILGAALFPFGFLSSPHLRTLAAFTALHQTGVTLLCGSIIAFMIAHTGKGILSWVRSPPLTFFGLISYALYMTHMYVLILYDRLHGGLHTGDNVGYLLRLITVLGATVLLCLLTRYLIELPALSLRKYVLTPCSP